VKLHTTSFALLLITITQLSNAAAPKVQTTTPDSGDTDVSPDTKEIRIEFDQPMNPRGRSVIGGGDAFPDITGDIHWTNNKTCIIPVTLKPNHDYNLSINSDTFRNFMSTTGQSADWYPIHFKTRADAATPAPSDTTPEKNKQALANLTKFIDEDYSYRDRLKIDWPKQIAARRPQFENAKTINEFARLAAHLLRLAEDPHIHIKAGDLEIGTAANSNPPNFNFEILQHVVPNFNQQDNGLCTGRFDKNGKSIGFILFSDCSKEQATSFDKALDQLKDTNALIIDARANGGGDELAAQKVAGRFVEKPAVYSKDRLRHFGQWSQMSDRTVEPRNDAPRYPNPVVVLIGPKIMSSAESFALMMQQGAHARLIGQTTRGSSGRPIPHNLGNGVTVFLPSWEDHLPSNSLLEAHGVSPDILIKTTPQQLQSSDPTLNAALSILQ
jgi:hypothetical protein